MENINDESLMKIESVLADLKVSNFNIVEGKDKIQQRLSQIKNILKEKTLTKRESDKLFRERTKLLETFNKKSAEQNEVKQKRHKYSLMSSEIKAALKEQRKLEVNPDLLLTELKHLKKYYLDFASDKSRVSSMRIMASEFANKIDVIINGK